MLEYNDINKNKIDDTVDTEETDIAETDIN